MLSSFKPIHVLKGKTGPKAESIVLRKGLVVFQFCVSIFLIVGTLLIGQQLTYLESKDMGFDVEHVLLVQVSTAEIRDQAETMKARWQAEAGVVSVSAMSGQPGGFHDATSVSIEGKVQESRLRTAFTDFDYVETLGLQIVAGRDFSKDFGTDSEQALLLNEAAVRHLGWTNDEAIGQELSGAFFDLEKVLVVGVVADYHFSSLKEEIEPLLIAIRPDSRLLAIKVKSEDLQGTISAVEQIWKTSLPGYPFEFTFLDETFAALYQQEQRESKLFLIFSVLSIMIASLGVFALTAYSAEERTREIGIRKTLGASVAGIVRLLSGEFVKLVLLANLIAWPVAWWAMSKWLQNFAYRIEISWWIFALAGGLALVIALLTVSTQAIRAAVANPVESLRYE